MNENNVSQNLLQAINEISERIFVSDVETYELLYINDIIKNEFNIDSCKGQKCYKLLQGADHPCPFCNNSQLKTNENYTWEFTNPLINRTFSIKDRLISWNGRPARLEVAFDITEIQKERTSLRHALDIHDTVLRCIKLLYQKGSLSTSMNSILKEIGCYLCAERSYIFEIQNDLMYNTYEWCNEGIAPQKDNLQALSTELITPWRSKLFQQKYLIIEDVDLEDNLELKHFLIAQQIHSLVIVPLESNGKLTGYFGVDNPPKEKLQNIVLLLDTLRYFILITLQRSKDARLLEHLSLHDSLTGLYNRNKYIIDLQHFPDSCDSIGIVFADINGLKSINDRFGHRRGDELIISCSRKLQKAFPDASIYRTGGDEFVILYPYVDKDFFLQKAKLLRQDFEQDDFCKAAVGWHWSQHTFSLEQMISLADQNMYKDKQFFYKHQKSDELMSSHIIPQ